ncbi:DNA-binding GntR family transcriptional regulator [Sulfitobacter undariae]|uniref:DNA-binding GntR family transcriptional regulator n=1 Tax=Sulfitobacter undariae TaxID=1563671 RepID=A0A7W6E6J9_9RHOB|nr:GntR family transcriptional regulator [Sulfitobacter undariae]MBB3995648.1 DNA-binding GntR family transcriptional regulator [Sulfitobacter undariae]
MYKSSTRSFPVYDSLRQAIIEQALKPGVKLPEDSIGETFGVSRTTVRNALVRLDAEGLVDLQPNRGASVAVPTIEEAYDIFEMRQCLEREVMQRLCKMDTKPIIKSLKAHLAQERKYLDVDTTRSIRLAGEFHILLAELTGSKILANYVNEIVSRCSLILARFAQAHSAKCGLDEHTEIIAAIEAGDAERAVSHMHHHLHGVQDRALLNPDEEGKNDISEILARYVTPST